MMMSHMTSASRALTSPTTQPLVGKKLRQLFQRLSSTVSYFKGKNKVGKKAEALADDLCGIGLEIDEVVSEIVGIVTKSTEIIDTESVLLEKLDNLAKINESKIGQVQQNISKVKTIGKIGGKLSKVGFSKKSD